MSEALSGKVALVTGGSRGIGAAIARRLAADGAAVAITYSASPDKADAVVKQIEAAGGKAVALQADAADPEQQRQAVKSTVEKLGRLDVFVNNAGVATMGPLDEVKPEDYDRQFAINVRGLFFATQEAARHLPEGGRIVFIGSNIGERVPFPGISVYAMTKAAVANLTRSLARELAPRNITVNNVAPGPIDTDMNPADGPIAEMVRSYVALGRHGTGDDVAAVVSLLAGPGGKFVTGATYLVDGGFNT